MLTTMILAALFITRAQILSKILGTALFMIGAGIILAGFSTSYSFLLGTILISALGQGLFEVLVTPFVRQNHSNEDAGRYVNITHAFWPAGIVSVVLLGGLALSNEISWRIILICAGMLSLVPGILFIIPSKTKISYIENKSEN